MWAALLLFAGQAERGPLMQSLQGTYPGALLDADKVAVSGWLEGSFTASSARRDHSPMGFNYRANEALLHQAWLRIDKPVDDDARDPTLGFRSDLFAGSDYRYTVARGLFDGQGLQGVDPVQFYGEARFPGVLQGLEVKVGRFFAPYGAESIDTNANPFVSRSYSFIYNPFTHTGALATLEFTDAWTAEAGLVAGSDVFLDPASRPTFIGGLEWKRGPDTVQFSAILGPGRFDRREAFNNPQMLDLVWIRKLDARLTATLEAVWQFQSGVPGLGTVHSVGVVGYLSYQATPRLTANARLEFYDDFQGQRTGSKGLYAALTLGVAWKPTPWVLVRPEVRYDRNGESRPFEGRPGLLTAALDAVIRF
ncbi:MAG: porin [Gemmataceae bacterium]|nr:porin [Gemmataceae bacterium]